MDTIDSSVMAAATIAVEDLATQHDLRYVHTVTVSLNGAHGGADLTIVGFVGADVSTYNEVTITGVIK